MVLNNHSMSPLLMVHSFFTYNIYLCIFTSLVKPSAFYYLPFCLRRQTCFYFKKKIRFSGEQTSFNFLPFHVKFVTLPTFNLSLFTCQCHSSTSFPCISYILFFSSVHFSNPELLVDKSDRHFWSYLTLLLPLGPFLGLLGTFFSS